MLHPGDKGVHPDDAYSGKSFESILRQL